MERVIVCGAGQVGFQIAKRLAAENLDVVVIDTSEARIATISESLDLKGVVGFASHPEVLERAGAADAELLIAATYSDEVNMVACQVGQALFNIPKRIARVRSQAYFAEGFQERLFGPQGLDITIRISPEMEVAKVVEQRLTTLATLDSAVFLNGRVRFVATRLGQDCPVVNTPLRQLTELFPGLRMVVLAYAREGVLHTVQANDQLFPGDEVYFIADEEHVERALGLLGRQVERAGRVVVIGAGNIGVRVAQAVERVSRVRLIERDRAQAERAAERLDRTIVLHGDGLDSAILKEAAVGDAEAVVTLTSDDKVNVLSAALAKSMGAKRAIALTNDPSFGPLESALGIDAFINPRATTVSEILRTVRRGRVDMVHSVRDGEGEIFEARVLPTTALAGKRIREIELPNGVVVGAVASGGKVEMAAAHRMIEAGDKIVLLALKRDLAAVQKLLAPNYIYFT